MLDLALLLAGLALPWALGIGLVALVYDVAQPRTTAAQPAVAAQSRPPLSWVIGCGWFIGILLVTLLMRAYSAAGVSLNAAGLAIPLAAITAVIAWVAVRRAPGRLASGLRACVRALLGAELEGWQRTAWRVLIAWLAIRFALLVAEVWWRPLYPWDAWTQWSTKARVWFELQRLVPFTDLGAWLGGASPEAYFDHAPHYPATVPLLQVWSALLIGRWDDALVNLPWWFTGVAFGVALFGGLADLRFPPLVALVGTALVLSLPILNVHIALAGYADLPMAAYIALGTLAALRAIRTRSVADGVLAVVLFAGCVMVKNPGRAWVLVLMPALVVAAFPKRGLQLAAIAFAGAALGVMVLVRSGLKILGYQLLPTSAMPWNALFDAYFAFGNWNLLWYAAAATAIFGARQLLSRDVAPFTCAVAAGLMFLFIGFAFTNAFLWVEDQSTVNRATLHLAPLVVVWMLVTLRAWLASRDAAGQVLQQQSG